MLRRVAPLVMAGALALGVSACGSSGSHTSGSGGSAGPAASGNPTTLLRQTFASTHSIKSGVLGVSLVIQPKGSSELSTPLTLTLGGPFQSSGGGHTAQSALTISFSGLGKHGSLGVTTTGSAGYVTLEGTSYKLPSADFKKLKNSLGTQSSFGLGARPLIVRDQSPGLGEPAAHRRDRDRRRSRHRASSRRRQRACVRAQPQQGARQGVLHAALGRGCRGEGPDPRHRRPRPRRSPPRSRRRPSTSTPTRTTRRSAVWWSTPRYRSTARSPASWAV